MSLEIITIGDSNSADIELLWFHGYGANNWGFEPFIKVLNLNLDGRLHVIMPNAPVQDGKRSWYPLPSEVDGVIVEDDDGLLKSKASLCRKLKEYLNNDKRLYIGGFSQGAALSLSLGLSDDISCEGIVAISGYIPSASKLEIKNNKKEIYVSHGRNDTTISIDTHNKSLNFLRENGCSFTQFTDNCGHTISKPMIENLTNWFYEKL